MKIFDCPQYTPEWWEARRGIPTASNFDRIITAKTAKPSAQAEGYMLELIADIACLNPPFFTDRQGHTAAMRNGINTEPEARRYYEMECGLDVREVGFCMTDDSRFGFSPDGLVGDEGGLELKCPELKTQLRYLLDGEIPSEYKAQVHGPLAIALLDPTVPFKWWDFMSYAPGAEAVLIRVTPDKFTEALAAALEAFDKRFQELKAKLLHKKEEVEVF